MNNNKMFPLLAGVAVIATILTFGCASNGQQTVQASQNAPQKTVPKTTKPPCFKPDTDEYYTGTGSQRVSFNSYELGFPNATTIAQDNMRQKVKHAYEGLIQSDRGSWTDNKGSDVEGKIRSAGDQSIDAIINRTKVWCQELDENIGEDGYVRVYIGIEVTVNDFVNGITAAVEDKLTPDEKLGIDFRTEQFREKNKAAFKKYAIENQPQ